MSSSALWNFGPFRLDAARGCLWRGEHLLPLPPKPLAVLAQLVAHAGEVVPKEALLEAVWPETVVSEGVLKTCMGQIRQVLGETAQHPQYIATVHRRGYRFIAPVTQGAAAPEASPPRSVSVASPARFVAREPELTALCHHWRQARAGTRQVVFITGEAGIGKTSLVDACVAHLGAPEGVWMGRGQCIEHYGAGEAYLPLFEALGQVGRGPSGARVVAILQQQAPSWVLQMPALVSAAAYEALQRRSQGLTRERMLRELAEGLEVLSMERPLVLILEDLHWSDHATLDWLTFVAHRRGEARLLILGTYRPAEAVMRDHPIRRVSQELQRHGQAHELPLGYLSEVDVVAYITQRFGPTQWPDLFTRMLHQRTNGHPFFLVTVVEELVRHGMLESQASGWKLRSAVDAVAIGVPESIRQLIEYQLTQVDPQEQEILAAASVVGIEFSAVAVAAQFFSVLRGLYAFSIQQAELHTARELAQQLHVLAQDAKDDALLVEAHRASGAALFYLGAFAQARQEVTQCLMLYNPRQHSLHTVLYGFDPQIVGLGYMTWLLWFLGYPAQAQAQREELLTHTQALSHPYSLAVALVAAATLHQFCREPSLIQADIQQVLALSTDYGFPHILAMGMILQGWAMAMQGRGAEGVSQLQEGLTAERATGEFIRRPYYLFLLAEAYGKVGQAEAGLHILAEALPLVAATAERWWEAELYRLKGELLLQGDNSDQARTAGACFRQALAAARRQRAKALELRVAISLSRLLQQQGKHQEAYNLLAPVYNWFTEGFDTADLQEAKRVIAELSGPNC